jgi:hypothetical protein
MVIEHESNVNICFAGQSGNNGGFQFYFQVFKIFLCLLSIQYMKYVWLQFFFNKNAKYI